MQRRPAVAVAKGLMGMCFEKGNRLSQSIASALDTRRYVIPHVSMMHEARIDLEKLSYHPLKSPLSSN